MGLIGPIRPMRRAISAFPQGLQVQSQVKRWRHEHAEHHPKKIRDLPRSVSVSLLRVHRLDSTPTGPKTAVSSAIFRTRRAARPPPPFPRIIG